MLIGSGFDRLEHRITNALCSGSLRLPELEFLRQVSRKIGLYRERTLLSNAQARWLFSSQWSSLSVDECASGLDDGHELTAGLCDGPVSRGVGAGTRFR